MATTALSTEHLRIQPEGGCGTLESPWTGWERQLETDHGTSHVHDLVLAPGFYGVSRPVRLRGGLTLGGDPAQSGRAWFLPVGEAELPTIFLVDGGREVSMRGVCFNGRGHRAHRALQVRCATDVEIIDCRFTDFGREDGAAVDLDGESAERSVSRVVLERCRIVNGSTGLRLGRHVNDLLVATNDFEEMTGSAMLVDPRDEWIDYGMIFVKNRIRTLRAKSHRPSVRIRPGAEGIRLAENLFERGVSGDGAGAVPALEVHGGGSRSVRRLEILSNQMAGIHGPGIAASECGPGFLVAGNQLEDCGAEDDGALRFRSCHGVLVEDNEIVGPRSSGIHAFDCTSSRLNGNEVVGSADSASPRAGRSGVLVDGPRSRRMRVTDNRVSCVRREGVRVVASRGVRIVGNEVQDCGEGIRVSSATNLLLVGNDCRDNGERGIQVDRQVTRGLVALNYAILNGSTDLEVLGDRIRCHSNKVDRQGTLPPESGPRDTDTALDAGPKLV